MFFQKRKKSSSATVLPDLFSPTVEFLSQPRGISYLGPWLPGREIKLPKAKKRLGKLYHYRRETLGKELCAVTLDENHFYFSAYDKAEKICEWKTWQTITLSPFCVCSEAEVGDNMFRDACTEEAYKLHSKGSFGYIQVNLIYI